MRYRLALGLAVVLAACSGGGSSTQSVPVLPWGSFRHDPSNSGVGGTINNSDGTVELLVPVTPPSADSTPGAEPTPVRVTLSTPAIDLNNNVVIGTNKGVMSVNPGDGSTRWVFEGYETATPFGTRVNCDAACDPDTDPTICTRVGSVSSSPTITAGGVIVFGTDATDDQPGALFAIQQNGNAVHCLWFFQPADEPTFSIKSSAIALVNSLDFSLLTVYSAGTDGLLRALNSDGSLRWSFPAGVSAGPITSTPALGATNIYVSTPDGVVSAIDFSGQLRTNGQVSLGTPPLEPFQPSPAVGPSVYAIGTDGTLFALSFTSPQSHMRWQFSKHCSATTMQTCAADTDCPSGETCVKALPISGSPAISIESFGFMATDVADTIVFVVDTQNFAYGVRDLTGALFQPQRCSQELDDDCRTDSCNPTGVQPPVDTCNSSTNRCMLSGQSCTRDSCVVNSNGNCLPQDGIVSLVDPPATMSGSPIVSNDPFVVIGTSDGRVCARSTANRVPGQSKSPPTATWRGGHCSATAAQACAVDEDCPSGETCTPPGGYCSVTTSRTCFPCPSGQTCGSDGRCSGGTSPRQSCGSPCPDSETCTVPGLHCSVTTSQTCASNSDCPDDETCVAGGPHCSVTTAQPCALDNNCPTNETCVFVGCIPLINNEGDRDPGPVRSSPIIGEDSRIYVTTDQGLYVIR